ncbi:sugar kinase, ribokinase [Terriglobus roseus DSM 18391]|uniref:Sugar kinase, ribokinase n=1 Tax=Terriglobus roseus (strain DSM 18391 / NRRL B-41598 / KBS 63) TaxID=926566 RepID=I3ZIR3_TERRK|nr:PfkB family carbohydrate kinase [Terriglobus roseus]AFL89131.1 sugar kinase, ribokinase [Terriglobus roseus DSM 18391]
MSDHPAVFGNFAIDDLVFADGSTRWGVPGGTAAYAALGAALWTGGATAVAPLGGDYPQSLLTRVDCSRCRIIPHTMRNWGLYEDDGTRHFVSRNRDRDWSGFCPTSEDAATGTQSTAHLAAMPLLRTQSLIAHLRQQGASTLSLDVDNHDLQQDGSSAQAHIDLIRLVDLYLPSQQDVARLLPGLPPTVALRRLRDYAPNTSLIAIKMGEAGVLAHVAGSDDCIRLPSVARAVVDTTGAGDAFCGGALAAYAEGLGPLDAIVQGSVSAALCVEGWGWEGLLQVSEDVKRERSADARSRVAKTTF